MERLPNRECPECKKNGHDSTGDHLFMMAGGDRWICIKREHHADGQNYYEDHGERDEQSIEESFRRLQREVLVPTRTVVAPVDTTATPEGTSGSARYTGNLTDASGVHRGIRPDVFEKFLTKGSYEQGDLVALVHPLYDLDGNFVVHKIRKLPKEFFTSGKTKGIPLQLFGQSVFPRAKRLLITEGELDAMSAYIMLEKYKVACVSLPTGANTRALADNLKYTHGFKEIYVCVDNDTAGKKVAKEIASLLPDARFLKISEKDANKMLTEGKQAEFVSAFFDAKRYQPDTVVRVADVIDKVMEKPVMGTPWPWESLTKATYGRRAGEGIYVGAGK